MAVMSDGTRLTELQEDIKPRCLDAEPFELDNVGVTRQMMGDHLRQGSQSNNKS